MDYEKKYNDVLERAKSVIKECGDNKGRITMIESIFPELASEDERIRRNLIEHLQYEVDDMAKRDCVLEFEAEIEELSKYIVWLEKQGEQKPYWSEDDEKMMQCIQNYANSSASNFDYDNIRIWFRNIKKRVQPRWKPTDGQMQALELIVQYHVFADQDKREKIVALFNDLKKL